MSREWTEQHQRLWEQAIREMERWNRTPDTHLILRLMDPKYQRRLWLANHFEYLAQLTRQREHDKEQPNGALQWDATLVMPTARLCTVRVLLNPANNEIFGAFVYRGRS